MSDTAAMTHTPTPYHLGYSACGITGPTTPRVDGPCCGGRDVKYEIITKGQETIAIFPDQAGWSGVSGRANAAFFFEAVNAYDSHRELIATLCKALEKSRTYVELSYDETEGEEAADAKYTLDEVDSALSLARERMGE